ncbi:hypothetical protein C4559_02805 [Candidatus Microgenomates bacterium]|nr:MAG: hypothetical protein C4559_02805 [Candidatus Microgenomates bacterium]
MADQKKEIEDLKTEVAGLKVRIRRIEDFLLCIPNSDEYISNNIGGEDELLEEAKKVVASYDRASASLLQRRLQIGYARAARILDELEKAGVVGPGEGAKPREVLIKK